MITSDLEEALRQALPHIQKAAAAELAWLVIGAPEGTLTRQQAQAPLVDDPALVEALRELAGRRATSSLGRATLPILRSS